MTRSQISYILSLIEIFSRKTRPISVTPKGQKIVNALKQIQREYLLLDEVIREVNNQEEGQIKLACIPTVATSLFPLSLDSISKTFQNVDFSIYELTTENILAEIKGGNIDLGIV